MTLRGVFVLLTKRKYFDIGLVAELAGKGLPTMNADETRTPRRGEGVIYFARSLAPPRGLTSEERDLYGMVTGAIAKHCREASQIGIKFEPTTLVTNLAIADSMAEDAYNDLRALIRKAPAVAGYLDYGATLATGMALQMAQETGTPLVLIYSQEGAAGVPLCVYGLKAVRIAINTREEGWRQRMLEAFDAFLKALPPRS